MNQFSNVVGPMFFWMRLSEYGQLLEIEEDSPGEGINGLYGFCSREDAVQGYSEYITQFKWAAPERLVLTERYIRDVMG